MVLRAIIQKTIFLCALCFLIYPKIMYGSETVDPTQVKNLLKLEKTTSAEDGKDENELVNELAQTETQKLGENNKRWNESNPGWKPIYEHVHSDLEHDMPKIIAAQTKFSHDYITDIASRIKQSDIDAVLAYYRSPEGQHYLKFLQQMDLISTAAINSIKKRSAQLQKPTQEQFRHNYQMLILSRLGRGMMAKMESDKAAHRDISGYGDVFGFILLGPIVNTQEPELESLYKQYHKEMPAFEAFSKKNTSRHFFIAEFQANDVFAKNSKTYIADMKDFNTHKREWGDLYQKNVVAQRNTPEALAKRAQQYQMLLPVSVQGWQVDESAEQAQARKAEIIPNAEPVVFHSYKQNGQEITVYINFPRPLKMLKEKSASGIGFSMTPDSGPIMVRGLQGVYYDFPHPAASSYGHQLQVYVGDDAIVSFDSNTVSKESLVKFANTFDYDKLAAVQ